MLGIFKKITIALLTLEARLVVRKYKPRIIAVTGSVGKTSTKDAIFAALAPYYHIRKSEKSFNSELGLPLTILGCPNAWHNPLKWVQNFFDGILLIIFKTSYPKWLVLEVGADRPGDIRKIAQWLPCDMVLITRLPEVPVHVEYFSSPEEVVEEKASLIGALKKGGTLVLYGDDERVRALSTRTKEKVLTFGFGEQSDIQGEGFATVTEDGLPCGMTGRVRSQDQSASISIAGTLGPYAFMPLLAATAVAQVLGENLEKTAHAVEEGYLPPAGRMRIVEGIRRTTLIDDTYNSSPAAVEAALETLKSISSSGKKIAVLGDMLELGRFSVPEHQKIGAFIYESADMLLTVGVRARDIGKTAKESGMGESSVLSFDDAVRAGQELARMLSENDLVLIKGSQSMRMEKVVEAVMEHPERAKELLVRQEEEWRKR